MSVTQRLQKIEMLEKEDRFHSRKLYGLRKKELNQKIDADSSENIKVTNPFKETKSQSLMELPNSNKSIHKITKTERTNETASHVDLPTICQEDTRQP